MIRLRAVRFFLFQAEDGIRDLTVTGVQTCALPIFEGLAGLGGRLALGVLADRLGVKRVLIAGLAIQAVAAFMFVFASRLGEVYAVAATVGVAYGGADALHRGLSAGAFHRISLGTVRSALALRVRHRGSVRTAPRGVVLRIV